MDLNGLKGARPSCFHLGLPKTGTTTLQNYLFPDHSQIYYLGKWTHVALSRHAEIERHETKEGHPAGCRNPLVDELLFQIFKENPLRLNIARSLDLFSQSVSPSIQGNRIPVWSWEGMAMSPSVRRRTDAQNLRTVFGPSKILIVLRNPVELLVSLYLQRLKANLWGTKLKRWGGPNFPTFEKWMQIQWKRLGDSLLDYARTIEIFADQFGTEGVGIFLFEQLQEDSRSYYKSICDFLQIDAQEAFSLLMDLHDNKRLTVAHMHNLREIRRRPWKNLTFRRADRRLRKKMVGIKRDDTALDAAPYEVEVSRAWRENIDRVTGDGNRYLAKTWNLPLEAYGYPL